MSKNVTKILRKELNKIKFQLLLPADYKESCLKTWPEDEIDMIEDCMTPEEDGRENFSVRMHKRLYKKQIEHLGALFGGNFSETEFEIKDVVPVMHQGWEMDEWAFMVVYKKTRYVIGTNHGRLELLQPADLFKKFEQYMEAVNHTAKARRYLLGLE